MASKLNDTQLTILTTAAGRDNQRVLPLPKLKAPPVAVRRTITTLLADSLIEEVPAGADEEVWDSTMALVITAAGLAAIGIGDGAPVSPPSPNRAAQRRTRTKGRGKGIRIATRIPLATLGDKDGRTSKQDAVIVLLRRKDGASIEEMMAATDWQAHSVRGFMSGALKERLGLEVVSEKDATTGTRRYYIAAIKSK